MDLLLDKWCNTGTYMGDLHRKILCFLLRSPGKWFTLNEIVAGTVRTWRRKDKVALAVWQLASKSAVLIRHAPKGGRGRPRGLEVSTTPEVLL